ncbi:hypothetical protein FE257_008570 [Aspergillus nanangensis]|uniref:Zn(2)-C6 fungal-type domain-containing protein n=1 Tax=Aspergillus nanangensis TaxID=2582783 RepID=A0AAD4GUG6_ASPNN|nr:hypothetical protein FE257_008570 [Aspergillus nanangensis]
MRNALGTPSKVYNACQRCRRQKLKCDIHRPCTLCSRAGVSCESAGGSRWRAYQPPQEPSVERPSKRPRTVPRPSAEADHSLSLHSEDGGNTGGATSGSNEPAWQSSSTMALVDGAFHLHNSSTIPATNAIPGGQLERGGSPIDPTVTPGTRADKVPPIMRSLGNSSRSAVQELTALFPSYEVAALLVDTYFDRVHWFMLIFHQDEFRQRWPLLYPQHRRTLVNPSHNIGFISAFLMVLGIGLQYVGDYRRRQLECLGVEPDSLKDRIFSAIKTKLLDLLSLGSLEAVQTCILLGTYYLYHGAPRLASPVCGCGLRLAQALNLHRRQSRGSSNLSTESPSLRMHDETRKRSWWAIYEIETFSSMTYGYPHSIKDTDYDVQPLDPSAKLQVAQSPMTFNEPLQCEVTLLSYKYFVSKLSVLTNEALTQLYRIGNTAENTDAEHAAGHLQGIIRKVTELDAKLQTWRAEVPLKLQWDQVADRGTSYSSADELDRDIAASGPRFEGHVYELQALTLKLAYENARILVHRPLVSYKLVAGSSESTAGDSRRANPFHVSLEACRHSALQISEIIHSPIVELVSVTYAASFVSIHVFTAGVLLAILSSIQPLTPQSGEAKVGLHRLMAIQEKLKDRSILAAQGLEILQRLAKLVMEKELHTMLDLSKPIQQSSGPDSDNGVESSDIGGEPVSSKNVARDNPHIEPLDNIPHLGTEAIRPTIDLNTNDNAFDNSPLQYMEDPALSAALYDLDQELSNYVPQFPSDLGDESNFSARYPPDEGFPTLEQTWIWGLDSIQPYGGE